MYEPDARIRPIALIDTALDNCDGLPCIPGGATTRIVPPEAQKATILNLIEKSRLSAAE